MAKCSTPQVNANCVTPRPMAGGKQTGMTRPSGGAANRGLARDPKAVPEGPTLMAKSVKQPVRFGNDIVMSSAGSSGPGSNRQVHRTGTQGGAPANPSMGKGKSPFPGY